MDRPVLTVEQLRDKLIKVCKSPKRAKQLVYMMVCEEGMTCREGITGVEPAQKYDGDFVWLWGSEEELPLWAGSSGRGV